MLELKTATAVSMHNSDVSMYILITNENIKINIYHGLKINTLG